MTFVLPNSRFGMSRVNYNLGALPHAIPEQDALVAANKLNEHRYLKLTDKQRVFVDAYIQRDFDTTAAAMEAGFSEAEAQKAGRKLFRRPEIQQAIQLALEYYSEATKLRFEQLVEELKVIAFTSITDIIDPRTVEVRDDVEDDDIRFRAVKRIKRTETKYGTNIEYEMYDRMGAIDKLMKILQPLLPGDAQEPGGSASGTTNNVTNNNVTNIAIVPVPSGQFLPPPPSPYNAADDTGQVIEHLSSAAHGLPPGVVVVPRASVPVEDDG